MKNKQKKTSQEIFLHLFCVAEEMEMSWHDNSVVIIYNDYVRTYRLDS